MFQNEVNHSTGFRPPPERPWPAEVDGNEGGG